MLHYFLIHSTTETQRKYLPLSYADEETLKGDRAGGWRAEGDSLGLNKIKQSASATP